MNAINGRKQMINPGLRNWSRQARKYARLALLLTGGLLWLWPAGAQSDGPETLSDQPTLTYNLPGNLAFVLSNEYPTNEDDANWSNYSDLVNYGGYFDPNKCYVYQLNRLQPGQDPHYWPKPGQSYFKPVTHAGGANKHFCDIDSLAASGSNVSTFTSASKSSGLWSGNLLNWSTMQTIDPVRAVLTGGFRSVDRASVNDPMPDGTTGPGTPLTVLEKAWNDSYYYGRPSSQMRGSELRRSWYSDYAVQYTVDKSLVGNLTPFGEWVKGLWRRGVNGSDSGEPDDNTPKVPGGFFTFIKGMGNRMQISPVDATLWFPLELPTLWDPGDPTTSAYYLDLLNIGWDNTTIPPGASPSKWPDAHPYYWDDRYVGNVRPPAGWTSNSDSIGIWSLGAYPPGQWSLGTFPPYDPAWNGGGFYGGTARCSWQNNPYPCYQMYVRVSVCENSNGLDGKSLLEDNCVLYPKDAQGNNSPHYKPEGLFQKYATQMRYSVISFTYRGFDYSLLRAPMRFIGQSAPAANPDPQIAPTPNPNPEWDANTGVQPINPNPLANAVSIVADPLVDASSKQDWPTKERSRNVYYPTGPNKQQSGLLNYINKYGEYSGPHPDNIDTDYAYKFGDPVEYLYYMALRYLRGPNNSTPWYPWSGPGTLGAQQSDSFPYLQNWSGLDDPILYRCQKNFILGISDAHSWNGDVIASQVLSAENGGNKTVRDWTDRVGTMEGIRTGWPANSGNSPYAGWPYWDGGGTMGTTGTYLTAGMAYYMHTNDIRPDFKIALGKLNGKVTVDTYWVDVTEFNAIEHLNPYMLAAKYGGFAVPDGFDPTTNTTALPQSWWNTTGDQMQTHLRGDPTSFSATPMPPGTPVPTGQGGAGTSVPCGTQGVSCWQTLNRGTYPRPDNYFTAQDSAKMVAGFQKAFANMVSAIKAYSTSFALSSSTVPAGTATYRAQYSPAAWTGTVYGGGLTITPGDTKLGTSTSGSMSQLWNTDGAMGTQLRTQPASTFFDGANVQPVPAYFGWRDHRRVITWSGSAGTPFRWNQLTVAQQNALYPLTYGGRQISLPNGGEDYVNYLRGDKTNEIAANIAGGANALRQRNLALGDIIDSSLLIVGAPQMPLSDQSNPGYYAFKTGKAATRTPMVYFGANDGMVHAINGDMTAGGNGGTEAFAYVPGSMFKTLPADAAGGTDTTPNNLLAWLGSPNYVHHYSVDATPTAFDVDFDRTGGPDAQTGNPDWHTILVGGLGKGGNSFYALDVTDPDSMAADTTDAEEAAAKKVLWEFTASDMGYSYGVPMIIKTTAYGWVVALTSGYNAPGGRGHLYLLNPKTGALLQEISTSGPSNGMTQASAFIPDYTSYVADAIYAGDLDGQIWRFDLTSLSSPSQGALLARLTDAGGTAQPVTTLPLIEIDPTTNRRFVLTGTGRLLNAADIDSRQLQDFYAIIDGKSGYNGFSAITATITRADLTHLTDVTAPPAIADKGWYLDLNGANYNYIPPGTSSLSTTSATGERVVTQTLSALGGIVSFSTDLMTPDPCLPTLSNVYSIYFGTGRTAFANGAAFIAEGYHVTNTRMFITADGIVRMGIGGANGQFDTRDLQNNASSRVRILNWRNVPVTGN